MTRPNMAAHASRRSGIPFLAICAFLMAAAWWPGSAAAQSGGTLEHIKETGEIRLAYREDASPFSFLSAEGKPAGYSVLLCRQIAVALQKDLKLRDLKVTMVKVTAQDRFEAIIQGKADLLCEATTVTLARREKLDFSITTFVSGASLVIRPGGPTSFDALVGKKISVLGGTTTEQDLAITLREAKVEAEVVVVKSHTEGFELLNKGGTDAHFGDRTILEDRIRRDGPEGDLLVADDYLTVEPFALAMPLDHDFRLAVDRVLSRLYRGGGVISIFRQAFGADTKPSSLLAGMYRTMGLPE